MNTIVNALKSARLNRTISGISRGVTIWDNVDRDITIWLYGWAPENQNG